MVGRPRRRGNGCEACGEDCEDELRPGHWRSRDYPPAKNVEK